MAKSKRNAVTSRYTSEELDAIGAAAGVKNVDIKTLQKLGLLHITGQILRADLEARGAILKGTVAPSETPTVPGGSLAESATPESDRSGANGPDGGVVGGLGDTPAVGP